MDEPFTPLQPVFDDGSPKIDAWAYLNTILSQIQVTLGRLDAKVDASASKGDVNRLRDEMIENHKRMDERVATLEQDKHDREVLAASHKKRDEREGMSRRQKWAVVAGGITVGASFILAVTSILTVVVH